jgi:hypothetical protein
MVHCSGIEWLAGGFGGIDKDEGGGNGEKKTYAPFNVLAD